MKKSNMLYSRRNHRVKNIYCRTACDVIGRIANVLCLHGLNTRGEVLRSGGCRLKQLE